jgi:hypothetical protein
LSFWALPSSDQSRSRGDVDGLTPVNEDLKAKLRNPLSTSARCGLKNGSNHPFALANRSEILWKLGSCWVDDALAIAEQVDV